MKTISDHVMDIVQNSVSAHSTLIEIIVDENKKNNLYTIKIKDNGCGMSEEVLLKAADPFFTSRKTRKVGLGLPLLKQNAEAAEGNLKIFSKEGKGTEVIAQFNLMHVDRPPLGDIWYTWFLLIISNPLIRIIYKHNTEIGCFVADSYELKEALGSEALKGEMKKVVIEWFKNNMEEIKVSK